MAIIVAIYDISSVQRLVDAAKIVYGMGFNDFVAVKVYGAAAQNGVPEVMKIAIKNKKNFHVLSSLDDIIEVFGINNIFVYSKEYGEEIDESVFAKKVLEAPRTAIVFGGSETSIGRREVSKATAFYIPGINSSIGPLGEMAITLYILQRYAKN